MRAEERLVSICPHSTAPFQLDILSEICEPFLFVNRGTVSEYSSLSAASTNDDVCAYLGALVR